MLATIYRNTHWSIISCKRLEKIFWSDVRMYHITLPRQRPLWHIKYYLIWIVIYNFNDLQENALHYKPERKTFFLFLIGETIISEKLINANKIPQPVCCSFLHNSTVMGRIVPIGLLYSDLCNMNFFLVNPNAL